MTQNDSLDIVEKWRDGVELSSAWQAYSDPYAVSKLRSTTSLPALQVQQILMMADLWAGLRAGDFLAFGKCILPEKSNGPVQIPQHMFEFAPPHGIGNDNVIEISGWRYDGVKVISVGKGDSGQATEYAEISATEIVLIPPQNNAPPPVHIEIKKRGGGRRDTYDFIAPVLKKLYQTKGYRSLSAEDLHRYFSPLFEQMFPIAEYNLSTPSKRTLRAKMKLFRQELVETGNN